MAEEGNVNQFGNNLITVNGLLKQNIELESEKNKLLTSQNLRFTNANNKISSFTKRVGNLLNQFESFSKNFGSINRSLPIISKNFDSFSNTIGNITSDFVKKQQEFNKIKVGKSNTSDFVKKQEQVTNIKSNTDTSISNDIDAVRGLLRVNIQESRNNEERFGDELNRIAGLVRVAIGEGREKKPTDIIRDKQTDETNDILKRLLHQDTRNQKELNRNFRIMRVGAGRLLSKNLQPKTVINQYQPRQYHKREEQENLKGFLNRQIDKIDKNNEIRMARDFLSGTKNLFGSIFTSGNNNRKSVGRSSASYRSFTPHSGRGDSSGMFGDERSIFKRLQVYNRVLKPINKKLDRLVLGQNKGNKTLKELLEVNEDMRGIMRFQRLISMVKLLGDVVTSPLKLMKNLFSDKGLISGIVTGVGALLTAKFLPTGLKEFFKIGEKGAAKLGAKEITKVGTKLGAKEITKVGTKLGAKEITKVGTKIAGKSLGKRALTKLPVVGALIAGGLAIDRLLEGDVIGAGLEALSGVLSLASGPGTAASFAVDAGIIARDLSKATTVDSTGTVAADQTIQQIQDSNVSGATVGVVDTMSNFKEFLLGPFLNEMVNKLGSIQNTSLKPRGPSFAQPIGID